MIPVPQFFSVVVVSIIGVVGIGQGQAAWQLLGLSCRMILFNRPQGISKQWKPICALHSIL